MNHCSLHIINSIIMKATHKQDCDKTACDPGLGMEIILSEHDIQWSHPERSLCYRMLQDIPENVGDLRDLLGVYYNIYYFARDVKKNNKPSNIGVPCAPYLI